MGLGRAQLEQSIVEAETSTRRHLDVEQQMKETEMQREQRMQRAEQREMVEQQVADMNRTFYCEVSSGELLESPRLDSCEYLSYPNPTMTCLSGEWPMARCFTQTPVCHAGLL